MVFERPSCPLCSIFICFFASVKEAVMIVVRGTLEVRFCQNTHRWSGRSTALGIALKALDKNKSQPVVNSGAEPSRDKFVILVTVDANDSLQVSGFQRHAVCHWSVRGFSLMATSSQSSSTLDERQPLLAKPADEEALESVPSSEPLLNTSEDTSIANGKDLEWSSLAWYTGLMIAGLVGLGLLIKGFIDAGDTKVRIIFKIIFKKPYS